MAYTAWSVVYGEQPTAAKWNQLGANDAGFKDGTNIDNLAILTRHLADANVTSAKLAEAFFRGRKQANTTNSAPTGLSIQHGWGFIQGNGTTSLSETVTFPVAFSSPPVVFLTQLSARLTADGAPTDTNGFTTGWSGAAGCLTDDITTTNFLVSLIGSGVHNSSFNFGYAWIAIGTQA